MNKVLLTGRLTKNPELRYTTSNVAVSQFSLAVTRNFKNAEGVYEADFINCVAYRKTAELIAEWTKKGDLLGIEGRIQTRSYDDKEGNKKYITEVIIENIEFLSSKKKEESSEEIKEESIKEDSDPFKEFGNKVVLTDDDLPF